MGKTNPNSSEQAISANRRVVTPGYIDMHTHSDQPLVADIDSDFLIR